MSDRSKGVTKVRLSASYTSAMTRSASCSTWWILSTMASLSVRFLAAQQSTSNALISKARAAPCSSRSKKCSSLGSNHLTALSIHITDLTPPSDARRAQLHRGDASIYRPTKEGFERKTELLAGATEAG